MLPAALALAVALFPFSILALQTEPTVDPTQSGVQASETLWSPGSSGPVARDAARGWDLAIGERGLCVQPVPDTALDPAPSWTFTIGTASFGRRGAARTLAPTQPAVQGERVDIDHGALTEWFVRNAHGVEHGWTIPAAPEGNEIVPLWVGLNVEGNLSMHVTDDGSGAFVRDARGVLQLRYIGLRAFDAGGRTLPARLLASQYGFGIEVDARDAQYPVTVDPLVTTAAWFFATGIANSGGPGTVWCRPAGDVNGDGFSDIIVGAARFDGPGPADAGRVWVFHGSVNGPSTTPNWYVDLPFGGQTRLTHSGIGDVNGDGYDDIAIGAPAHGPGRLYVWFGGPTGLGASPTTAASADYTTDGVDGSFSWVQGAGDLNGDGFGDFVGGSIFEDNPPLQDAGAVRVFLGSPSGPVFSKILRGTQALGAFGQSCGGAGDLNADGFDDLVVGEPGYDGIAMNQGRVHLFLGAANFATAVLTTSTIADSTCVGCALGSSVDTAGDIDGDGFADVVAGAPGAVEGEAMEGGVHLIKGGFSLPSVTSGYFQSNVISGRIGEYVSCAGDIDGDGFADVIASAPGVAPGGTAYLILGGPTAFTHHAGPGDQGISPDPSGTGAAQNVAGAGDVNGDGFGDVLMGAPFHAGSSTNEGAWFLHFGSPNPQPGAPIALAVPSPLSSGPASSRTGRSVSSAGDVNGDGFNDVVVGSPAFSPTDNGRVEVFLGSASGLNLASPFWTFVSPNPGEQFGWSVSAGDIDNDGFSDILVGAPNFSNAQTNAGRVVLFRSLGTSISASPTWIFHGSDASGFFGSSVSALGDVNADGFNDIAVGAPGAMGGQGSVRIFHGRATGLASITAAITITSGVPGSEFGTAVALVGDVNLDGFGDLAVGAPKIDNPQVDEGRIYVYLGSYTGISGTIAGQEESQQAGAQLGSSIAQCGDVNGDGRAEILVGAPGYDAATNGGAAFLYQALPAGAGITLAALAVRTGAQASSQYGFAVSAGGDVNGDGWNDVLVGSPEFDGSLSNQGRIYLYLGSSTGLATSPSETYDGPLANARFGESIALGGDVNGDGLSDPIGGVPSANNDAGGVIPLNGGGVTAWRASTSQRVVADAQALQILGRTNELNQFQINLGLQNSAGNTATAMGRAPVKLEWEIQPVGTTLNGSAIQAQTAFVNSGALGSGLRLSKNVTGLLDGTAYHWRARTVVRNPYYPHTRWTTIQLDGLQEKKLGMSADCNNNGIGDTIDLALATSLDCNANTIPDECDISGQTSLDCDGSGTPDECDYLAGCGLGNDADLDGILDTCQLAGHDCNNNGIYDIREILCSGLPDTNGDDVPDGCQTVGIAAYCFGDGSGTACPCSNAGAPGNGCANSIFAAGANLAWSGVPAVSHDTFVLLGTNMPNSSALYFQGTGVLAGGAGSLFGDGLRCAGGSIIRLGTKINASSASQYPIAGDPLISVRGLLPPAGGTRKYQVWYRNAAAFCTASTFNLSNGLSVLWVP